MGPEDARPQGVWAPACPPGAHTGWQMPPAGQDPLSPQLGACGGTYTSPDIPTGPASPLPAALQLVEQRDDLSSPCAAQRVAQGHCTPQRVHLLRGEFQLLHTVHSLGGGEASAVDPSLVPFAPSPLAPTGDPRPCCKTKAHLTGKGLVDLKDVHVVHRQPCRPGGKT